MAGKGRAPCCDKNNVKKGSWSPAEDLKLAAFIQKNGHGNWRSLPKQAGLARCGKSCRLRWINYLSPNVKRGNFTLEEEEAIIRLHNSYGNKWSKIAAQLPGRTDNEIKNVWNTHLKKRLIKKDSELCRKNDKLSKGTSIISPSSPSSSSTSNVSFGDQNAEEKGLNGQDFVDVLTETSTKNSPNNNKPKETSRSNSFSSNVSNASNLSSSSQVDVAIRPSHEMDSIIFNSEGLDHVHNAMNEINNELFLDPEFDIWNHVLENLESFEAPQEQLVDSMPSSKLREKHEMENEQSEWLRYLENYELGLEGIIGEDDQNKAAENDFEEMGACFPLWPPSPHNFDI